MARKEGSGLLPLLEVKDSDQTGGGCAELNEAVRLRSTVFSRLPARVVEVETASDELLFS